MSESLPLVALSSADIACIVDAVSGGSSNIQDIYPLAPLQEGILFHYLLASEADVYLQRSMYRFDSRARLDRFLNALRAVIDRHDILRTSVLWEGLPEPVQVVWRKVSLVVEEVVIDAAAGDVVEELAARFDPRHYRLDIRQAPLLRVAIAYDSVSDRWAMVLLLHHLIDDNTSLRAVRQDIQAHLLGCSDHSQRHFRSGTLLHRHALGSVERSTKRSFGRTPRCRRAQMRHLVYSMSKAMDRRLFRPSAPLTRR